MNYALDLPKYFILSCFRLKLRCVYPASVREKLIKKLQEPEGETSYGKLQIWLEKECGIKVSYKVVHDLVHYKLKSYLKVPRPQSNKVNEVAQTNFKKKTVGDYQSND